MTSNRPPVVKDPDKKSETGAGSKPATVDLITTADIVAPANLGQKIEERASRVTEPYFPQFVPPPAPAKDQPKDSSEAKTELVPMAELPAKAPESPPKVEAAPSPPKVEAPPKPEPTAKVEAPPKLEPTAKPEPVAAKVEPPPHVTPQRPMASAKVEPPRAEPPAPHSEQPIRVEHPSRPGVAKATQRSRLEPKKTGGSAGRIIVLVVVVLAGFGSGYLLSQIVGTDWTPFGPFVAAPTPDRSRVAPPIVDSVPAPKPVPTPAVAAPVKPSAAQGVATPLPPSEPAHTAGKEQAPPLAEPGRGKEQTSHPPAVKPKPPPKAVAAAKPKKPPEKKIPDGPTGTVVVKAPTDVHVYIDGKPFGKGNIHVAIPAGNHRLTVTLGESKTGEDFQLEAGGTYNYEVTPKYDPPIE